MPLTKYMRKQILKMVAGRVSFSQNTWLALLTSAVDDSGASPTYTEVSGNGYARADVDTSALVNVGYTFPTDPTESGGLFSYTNNKDIMFPEATGSWGTVTHFAIFTAQTGGNMIAYGQLSSSITPTANTIPVVRSGQLTITEASE